MDSTRRGSFRLFQVRGIDVYLHWSWFIIAYLQISSRPDDYGQGAWKVIEYVSLFLIVLLHELGHCLACRSTGGKADTIVLWPLGGIAYVAPPARPGAFLWSIAAGPLVNLVLVVPTFAVWHWGAAHGWRSDAPDLYRFAANLSLINLGLLLFNMLPIYPLDGGQILQALLWFGLGRWRSLLVVSLVGLLLGGGGFAGCLFLFFSLTVAGEGAAGTFFGLLGVIAAFVGLRSFVSFQQARVMLMLEALPRHHGYACPSCATAPPHGAFWVCEHCGHRFDLFASRGQCSACGAWYLHPDCVHCRESNHIDRWEAASQPSRAERSPPVSPPALPGN